MLTYKKLQEILETLSEEQLDKDVILYNAEQDEYYTLVNICQKNKIYGDKDHVLIVALL